MPRGQCAVYSTLHPVQPVQCPNTKTAFGHWTSAPNFSQELFYIVILPASCYWQYIQVLNSFFFFEKKTKQTCTHVCTFSIFVFRA